MLFLISDLASIFINFDNLWKGKISILYHAIETKRRDLTVKSLRKHCFLLIFIKI
jgi:hypothetical protein